MLSLSVSSFCKNRICCWCNSLSLDWFAENFKKQSLNELMSLKIRSLISAIICNGSGDSAPFLKLEQVVNLNIFANLSQQVNILRTSKV